MAAKAVISPVLQTRYFTAVYTIRDYVWDIQNLMTTFAQNVCLFLNNCL